MNFELDMSVELYSKCVKYAISVVIEKDANVDAYDIVHDLIIEDEGLDERNFKSKIKYKILSSKGNATIHINPTNGFISVPLEERHHFTCRKCKDSFPDSYRVRYQSAKKGIVEYDICVGCYNKRVGEWQKKARIEGLPYYGKKLERERNDYSLNINGKRDSKLEKQRKKYSDNIDGARDKRIARYYNKKQ
jgi:Pyruvate/2-oxoacid:ferredoxin oxidoreductase delta subunit